nr:MAG TPA: hypothetical protein [Caudoviricetes sp.]
MPNDPTETLITEQPAAKQQDTPTPTPTEPATGGEAEPATGEAALGDPGKRAIAAERDARRTAETALRDLRARAEATDAQYAAELAEARKAAEAARVELAREQIARRHGLSDDDTALLTGPAEHMEALAARLAATRPTGNPAVREGAMPQLNTTPAQEAAAAEAAGDRAAALAAKTKQLLQMIHAQ